MSRHPLVRRALAAGATFSVGAALLAVLGAGGPAVAQQPQLAPPRANTPIHSVPDWEMELAIGNEAPPPNPNPPPPPPPSVEEAPPKPSPARKFLPVRRFGGY